MFAHNGQIRGIKSEPLTFYAPIGTTDSERAFCWILDQVRQQFAKRPRNRPLWGLLGELCRSLHERGVANILLSDSKYLYALCSSKLCWITRRAPFGPASLVDADLTVNFEKETTPHDVVTVVATQPLTRDEEWRKMMRGQFCIFADGEVICE